VISNVPFFDSVYEKVGEFAEASKKFNEAEELALKILEKLYTPRCLERAKSYGFMENS